MIRIDSYMEFINEEFFRKIFNKKKTNKSSKKSRLDTCLFNILEFLKGNDINDWNDFMGMSQFDREIVDKIIDHEIKNFDELKEIKFLIKLELADTQQLREFLTEYEDKEEYEKCAQIIKKISSK
jgi:hypothetical protein